MRDFTRANSRVAQAYSVAHTATPAAIVSSPGPGIASITMPASTNTPPATVIANLRHTFIHLV